MELLTLFAKRAPNRVFASILLGGLAGLSYAMLIPVILLSAGAQSGPAGGLPKEEAGHFLGFEVAHYRFAIVFVAVCLFILMARSLSQILLSRVALDATTDLRVRAYRSIARAPIAELERLGTPRIMAAITTDIQRIVMGAGVTPIVLVSSVTLTGMLAYLFVLSRDVFWFVVGALAFGVTTYQIPMFIGRRYFERGRANVDALFDSIRGLIGGKKELKLSSAKRERFFADVLLRDEYAVLGNSKKAGTIVTAASNYGDLLSFFTIGTIAFVFVSYHSIAPRDLIGVIMVLLYITGPVASLLNAIPQVVQARVSLRSIRRVFDALSAEDDGSAPKRLGRWKTVRFQDIRFHYESADGSFSLGPVSLDISKGDITFIVGGNGSGKSTLGKVISLLYLPAHGEIRFGEERIDRGNVAAARDCVSAIFSDYHLFDQLLDHYDEHSDALVRRHLAALGLDSRVSMENGRFSTLSLSDGQRKRLALLVAFLDDREIYVFDEWAADQDPQFKDVFYRRILPELKARNKAIVVISHDDRYFDVADRIVVMEDGKVVSTRRVQRTSRETQPDLVEVD